MKHLKIENTKYITLTEGFTDWLTTLNYSRATIKHHSSALREFLYYLETNNINALKELKNGTIFEYKQKLEHRPNHRTDGGLSAAHINKHISALHKFFEYLDKTKKAAINIKLSYLTDVFQPERTILTETEIRYLYNACEDDAIGLRDRAMLGIYYGCGLRKNEGLQLVKNDVLFEKRLLYVRKTKNRKERYVPVIPEVLKDFENYIFNARLHFLPYKSQEQRFFISQKGKPLSPGGLVYRLEALKNRTNTLKDKSFGLHSLRHSIATHLLQKGIALEEIARFLGHKTMDSTQIYTHLKNENS